MGLRSPFDVADKSGGQYGASTAARSWTALWLTIKALGLGAIQGQPGFSLPVRVSFKSGNGSFMTSLVSNPRFHELLMGWPTGWSDPAQPATGFAAWLRRSRGALSRLTTSETP
ncbi:MAG: hypothetical protein QHC67_01275 [Sphingobium sp.]|uniref:hypothetical protein n=1 Tax=Sphingobium sp. TaxID=1912891 RepID=UPI0029AA31EA|nr:hypothetical protein [Sphingobium sp.]MDX3908439.1 hypothetical protein [Sphingobium sp.]